jgi:hypothetical protein
MWPFSKSRKQIENEKFTEQQNLRRIACNETRAKIEGDCILDGELYIDGKRIKGCVGSSSICEFCSSKKCPEKKVNFPIPAQRRRRGCRSGRLRWQ